MDNQTLPYMQQAFRTATASASYVIQFPPLAEGEHLVIDWVGVTNEDDNNRDIDVGVRSGNRDYWFYTIAGVTKTKFFGHRFGIHIFSEQRLIFRVRSPQVGNRTIVTAFGHYILD